jgi:hypothetical protein
MSMAKRLSLFDNLIEFTSGIKIIEVSGIQFRGEFLVHIQASYLCPRYGSID